jgi:hypothetical protein
MRNSVTHVLGALIHLYRFHYYFTETRNAIKEAARKQEQHRLELCCICNLT